MNVKRGLLRLWMFGTVLWVLAVCFVGWTQLLEPCWGQFDPVVSRDGRTMPLSLMGSWGVCIAHKMQIPGIALIPPLAVLALGYAVGWIARGFQKA